MATDLENLQTRRTAILEELAALNTSLPGGRPNISGAGAGSVDHVGYKRGLYEELEKLDRLIGIAEGPWETATEGHPD